VRDRVGWQAEIGREAHLCALARLVCALLGLAGRITSAAHRREHGLHQLTHLPRGDKLVRRGGQARGPKGWREGEEESGGPLACAMGISAHLPLFALVELALGRGVEGRSGRGWRVHRRMPNPQRRHGRSAARAQHRLCTVAQHAPATCPELAHALADTRRRGARTRRLGRLLRHLPY
jgi:hypothetical protein